MFYTGSIALLFATDKSSGNALARAISAGTLAISTRLTMFVPYNKNCLKFLEQNCPEVYGVRSASCNRPQTHHIVSPLDAGLATDYNGSVGERLRSCFHSV
jgi:hypothetical protein